MAQAKAMLLDVDGTLVDSNDAHARAWVEVLAEFKPASFERVRELIGKGGDKLLPEVTGIANESELAQTIKARRKALFMQKYLPHLRPFPKVRELLERFRADGLALIIATSAGEEEMHALVQVAGIADLLDNKASSGDAARSKPDPDIVTAALQRAQVSPEEAWMLGDTPYDVEASQRAGVKMIALRSGGWGDEDLAGAEVIYENAAELLTRYNSSPLAQGALKLSASVG